MAPVTSSRRFKWDAVERVAWTGLEVVAGVAITALTPLKTWWAPVIAAGLAALKALAAKRVGIPNTGSTLPPSADPAAPRPVPAPPPPQ